MIRYDVIWNITKPRIEQHFCRDYECLHGDVVHGVSWERAKYEIIDYYTKQTNDWKHKTEDEYFVNYEKGGEG